MAYREAPLQCPACNERMEERPYAAASVDVCTGCYGVWIEWFDGELPRVARSIPPPSRPGGESGASGAGWNCPVCRLPLATEPIADAAISRCGECAGAFLTRRAVDAVAEHARNAPPPEAERSGTFERLVLLVRSLFVSDT